MKNWKLWLILLLTLVLLILIAQNTAPVETKFFMATVTMPRAALLFVTGLLGFFLGLLVALRITGRRTPSA